DAVGRGDGEGGVAGRAGGAADKIGSAVAVVGEGDAGWQAARFAQRWRREAGGGDGERRGGARGIGGASGGGKGWGLGLGAVVGFGDWPAVGTKVCVAPDPTPLLAVMVMVVLPVGVVATDLIEAVPSPLSVKVAPAGRLPLSVSAAVGKPVVVTVNVAAVPV